MKRVMGKYSNWIILALDGAVVLFSWWLAFQLRFDFNLPAGELENMLGTVFVVLVLRLTAFNYFGLYRGLYRYASLADLTSILKAVVYSQVALTGLILFLRHAHFPRSVLVIDPVMTLFLVGFVRFAIRATRDWRYSRVNQEQLPRALIYGAGDLGESVLRDLQRAKKQAFNVVGFLDDDHAKWNHQIHGLPILGGKNLLPGILEDQKIDQVIVAVNHSRGPIIKGLMALCAGGCRGVQFKTVPTLEEHLSQKSGGYSIRKIELSDLLPRKKFSWIWPRLRGSSPARRCWLPARAAL